MLQRLQALADEKGLEFGVKITNTFPVDVKQNELPSEEMYMSGKSLYPLSMSVAKMLAEDLEGSCAFPIPAALTSLTSRISWMQASGRDHGHHHVKAGRL